MRRPPICFALCAAGWLTLTGCAISTKPRSHPDLDSPEPSLRFLHMQLDLRLRHEDIAAGRLHGSVTHRFTLALPCGDEAITAITLDAVDLDIRRVADADSGVTLPFRYDGRKLRIDLARPLPFGQSAAVRIDYSAHAHEHALYFVRPDDDHPDRPTVIYTMSEALKARYWVPCHDWPNVRWPSDITITVPRPYVGVSVGAPVGEPQENADGSRTFAWRIDTPIDPHLLGVAIGEFQVLEDDWRGMPVRAYVQPGLEDEARWTFRHTSDILAFYSSLLRTEYPFAQFAHVTIQDHFHGGMEHAGFDMIAPALLTAGPLGQVPDDRAQYNYVAHMLGHAWFAGVTSYANVREAWLNESFATYLHELWRTQTHGDDMLPHRLDELARLIARFDIAGESQSMIPAALETPDDVYAYDAGKIYWKGAWTVHMLRSELGDDVFWRAVAAYLERFRGRSVTTDDLQTTFEKVTDRDLGAFFDQWVRRGGMPQLSVTYQWDADRGAAIVNVRQTQPIDPENPPFAVPLEACFRVAGEWTSEVMHTSGDDESFEITLAAEPDAICIDPRARVLAIVETEKPLAMWRAQAEHGPTALARQRAIDHLRSEKDADAVDAVRAVARNASEFFATRAAAVAALAALAPDDCLADLAAVADESDQRPELVVAVLHALENLKQSAAAAGVVQRFCNADREITMRAAALGALAKFDESVASEDRIEVLIDAALPPTSRFIRAAALRALASQSPAECLRLLRGKARFAERDDLELRVQTVRLISTLAVAETSVRPVAVELLEQIQAHDTRPSVQVAVRAALEKSRGKQRAAARS